MILETIKPIAKAIIGCLVAGLGALATALADDMVTQSEWVTIALAALTAAGAIWAVPNRPHSDMAEAEIEAQSIQERDM